MRPLALPLLLAGLAAFAAGCVVHTVQPGPAGGDEYAWVCHGKKGTWKRVGRSAIEGHARHGDRVSHSPQPVGARCD